MKYSIVIFVILVLTSCKIDSKSVVDVTETYFVSINENSKYSKEYIMSPRTKKHSKFIAWFKENELGWESTLVTYMPNIVVMGKRFSINFHEKAVVLNYDEGQYIKDIDADDYDYLLR